MVYLADHVLQARYFKNMLKEANHLNAVKRLRIAETDLAPLTPSYEVRGRVWSADAVLTSFGLRMLSQSLKKRIHASAVSQFSQHDRSVAMKRWI